VIDKKLKYLKNKAPKGEFLAYINAEEAAMLKRAGGSGKKVNGIPSFRPQDMGNAANQAASANNPGIGGGGAGRTDGGDHSKDPRTVTVTSPRLNRVTGAKIPDYKMTTTYSPKSKTGFGPKGKDTFHEAQIKNMRTSLREVNPGFFDSGLGKFVKGIGMFYAPQIFGPKFATGMKIAKSAKVAKDFLDQTDILSTFDVKNPIANMFSGNKTSTSKSTSKNNTTTDFADKKGGGDGDGIASLANQASSYDEYILLLQKLQSGNISDSEQNRFNVLKNMLGI